MDEVEIIVPAGADMTDVLDSSLVALTETISQIVPDAVAHGILGGEFGYGARYENDVFVMRPFYWGDCDCGWMEKEDAFCVAHGYTGQIDWVEPPGWADAWQAFLAENPGHLAACALELPNFLHKASGLRVDWYKYIGRGMHVDNSHNADILAVMQECIGSVRALAADGGKG